MAKTKRKRGAELPSPIPAFIESVTSTPLENIEAPLSTFTWNFEKGDLYHWVDLFNHFESFCEKFVKPRRDLQLDGDFVDVGEPLPVSAILEILRLSRIILENCNNKHLYSQIEHLSSLLAATNADVTAAALETLVAFVKKPLQSARGLRWHGDPGLNSRLFSLSQGWGGKEEGLGLLACAEEAGVDASTQRLGCMLHFEFYSEKETQKVAGTISCKEQSAAAGLHVIHVPDVHLRPESDLQLLKSLVDQHGVPKDLRFSLLTRLRFARAFASLEGRRQFIRIRLLALTVLLQSNPNHEDLAAFSANEPEFVSELVSVVRAEDSVPEDIRTLAILALAAQAQDRQRQQQVLMVMGAGGHRGILPSLIQKAVTGLHSGKPSCSLQFVEALLSLVSSLVSSSSGGNALREAGLVPTLLPLMKDHDSQHLHIVCAAVHILETFMDHLNTAPTLFRDLGGLEDSIDRLWVEVSKVESAVKEEMEEGQLTKGKMPVVDEDVRPAVALGKGSASYLQRQLMKALLRAIALGHYTPGSSGRLQEDSRLPACLCVIFRHAKAFGGGVFATAAQVMSDLIHNDPTCYAALDAAGLPGAFLDTIGAGILPSSEAICCIPSALNALCLNHTGLQAVRERDSLSTLVPVFTSRSYQKAMAGDTPQSLGQSLEELMRHVPVLRPAGVAMVVRMLKTIAAFGGAEESAVPPSVTGAGTSSSSMQRASSISPTLVSAGVVSLSVDSIMTDAAAGTSAAASGSQDGDGADRIAGAADGAVPMETDCEEHPALALERDRMDATRIEQSGAAEPSSVHVGEEVVMGAAQTGTGVLFGGTEGGDVMGSDLSDGRRITGAVSELQLAIKTPDMSPADIEAFLPECISNAIRLLEPLLQNAPEHGKVFVEQKGIEAVLQIYTLPYLPVTFGGSHTAQNMTGVLRLLVPHQAPALVKAIGGVLREQVQIAVAVSNQLHGKRLSDIQTEERGVIVRQLSSAECLLSLAAVLVKSTASMMQEMSSSGAEVVNDIGRLHRNILWQLAILDETKVEQKKQTEAATGSGGREGEEDGDGFPIRYSVADVLGLRHGPSSQWGLDLDYLVPPPGEGFGRGRGRRDHGTNAGSLGHIHHHHHGQHQHQHHHHHHHPPRLGRISRHVDATPSDNLDSPGIGVGGDQGKGRDLFGKKKTPEMLQYEMLGRLAVASRAIYSALAKAMVAPSRRRDDTVALTPLAKTVASALARVLSENLAFEGYPSIQGDGSASTKCRYIGRVLDDISMVVFDARRRTCNTAMLNTLYGYGTLKQLLATFQSTSLLLWTHPTAMDMEGGKGEGSSSDDRSDNGAPWLVDTLAKFARFLEQIVTASFLLTPASSAQLLVQPLPNAVRPIPKDPESFVRAVQVEVLEVVLPLWNHELFFKCNPAFVMSVTAIINHAYSGTGIQGARGVSAPGALARPTPPPPDEGSVAMIVSMGFSRARAEEALQRVGSNSVEMAVEWLFSHPEEPAGEDDELARALAMSLGNAEGAAADDGSSKMKEEEVKEEGPQMPLVEDVLNSSMKLLQHTDVVAFPVADLLTTLCNRSKGEDRPRVVSYLVDRLRQYQGQELASPSSLSTIAHTLALVVHEDPLSREFAASAGVTGVAIELLTAYTGRKDVKGMDSHVDVPKWVTALLLLLDSMLQFRSKAVDFPAQPSVAGTDSGSGGGVGPTGVGREGSSKAGNAIPSEAGPSGGSSEERSPLFSEVFGSPAGYLSEDEQRQAMAICCCLLLLQLSPMAMQAVLQLCSRLTKSFPIAMQFLELKGLASLLALPKVSLFPGFEPVAASIIRHLLEDPQTLQQAMESEIRHTLVGLIQRNNSKVSARQFLTALNPVMMRNPTVFMQAVAEVCQLETVGGRSVVVLSKEKERGRSGTGPVPASNSTGVPVTKPQAAGASSMAIDSGVAAGLSPEVTGKAHEGVKSVKGHRKVPHSFAQVIDQLLEVILYFSPPSTASEPPKTEGEVGTATAMDVDEAVTKDKGKGKVDEGIVAKESSAQMKPSAEGVAISKVSFILKLMTEVLLAYSSAASVVLRRDTESSMGRGPVLAGQEVFGHGGLIYHVLHRLLPFPGERKPANAGVEDDRAEKLGERAAYFVMALCVRSSEGRRRVAMEVTTALASQPGLSKGSKGLGSEGSEPPRRKVRAFVDLANSLISAQVAATNTVGLSSDMIKTMVEAGMVEALTHTLQVVDLDHPDTPKFVNGVLKALEALTRMSAVTEPGLRGGHSNDAIMSALTAARAAARAQLEYRNRSPVRIPPPGNLLPPVHVTHAEVLLPDEPMRELGTGQQEQQATDPGQHGNRGAGSVADGRVEEDVMEHDDHHRLNREMEREAHLAAEAEEAFMREAAEDVAELDDDGGGAIAFQMEHDEGDEDVTAGEEDDSDDMDGEEGDDDGEDEGDEEEDEEEGEEEDMEGDEDGLQASTPPDTDHEDNEDHALGDDFEDDMVDEEEEDWHDDRVIELRWRDGLTGLNHVQVLGAQAGGLHGELGGPNGGDPFHAMNIDDVFGSFRRAAAADRRRGSAYRAAFNEARMRADAGRIGPFNHPLLTRPPPMAPNGPLGQVGGAGGAWMRDAEAMLLSGGMDVTHLYLYDGPMLADYMADGFGVLGPAAGMFGGPPPPLLDFTVDPGYLLGGRGPGMRQDGRMMAWTDDGQPQGGAQAAAFASAAEDQFMSHMRSLNPSQDQQPAPGGHAGSRSAEGEQRTLRSEDVTREGTPENIAALQGDAVSIQERRVEGVGGEGQVGELAVVEGGQSSAQNAAEVAQHREVDMDTQMQDDRVEPQPRDMEAASQDSGGSGATVGESLRSLEVEIGSADGRDESERHAGRERIGPVDVPGPIRGSTQTGGHGHSDEDMGVASGLVLEQRTEGVVAPVEGFVSQAPAEGLSPGRGQGSDEAGPSRDGAAVGGEGAGTADEGIDPAFLEALPEDLRAEVLASQQAQARAQARAAASPAEDMGGQGAEEFGDLDPEVLAALPPEIQAEVLAQQRLQRAAARAQAAVESGQPVDMDSASIIATFPAELREEVLLTSSEAVLAALPPALLAEARLLQERRALNDFQHRGLFGINRLGGRGRAVGVGTGGGPGVVDRGVGGLSGRRPGSSAPGGSAKVKEVEGKPMADVGALKVMIRLLRLAQPLGKNLLQRLLLNLCSHSQTRSQLLSLLLDMLRPEAENIPAGGISADGALPSRLYGCQPNVVYGRSQQEDGIPPLVSRRVLEILTYLARHHHKMAHLLLFLRHTEQESGSTDQRPEGKDKGKGKVLADGSSDIGKADAEPRESPLVLLLKLLNQPLYSRSSAHLEQVMGLLEVVTRHAGQVASEARSSVKIPEAPAMMTPAAAVEGAPEASPAVVLSPANEAQAMVAEGSVEPITGAPAQGPEGPSGTSTGPLTAGSPSSTEDALAVLLMLPEKELRVLCKLLAHEGLSETAYNRTAEVLKLLADATRLHRKLFIHELADAASGLSGAAIKELESLGDADIVGSTSSMAGAAELRVLQALSSLIPLPAKDGKEKEGEPVGSHDDGLEVACRLNRLNESLEPLWQGLSVCVSKIETRISSAPALAPTGGAADAGNAVAGGMGVAPPLPPGTQKVLPMVEAFFVLCSKMRGAPTLQNLLEVSAASSSEVLMSGLESSSGAATPMSGTPGPSTPSTSKAGEEEKGMTFMKFADKHRRLLNAFIRHSPQLLEGSLSLLLKTPRLIDFDNKRSYFRARIRQQHDQPHLGSIRIHVRRNYVLEDSYNQLRMRTPDELKGRLTIQFSGEEGIDAGGLTREWYQVLSRVIFDKGTLLFNTVGNDATFQPNPNSVFQTEHLSYFKFVGRVVAKALFDGQLLDVYFTRSFYKHILGSKVTYRDLEAIEPALYKNLVWVLENNCENLSLTFCVDADEQKRILYEKNEVTDYELIPGGRNVPVTEKNKQEYVDLKAEHIMTTAIRPQINAFLEGFQELISRDLISLFNDKELELLISGLPEINIEDLKSNTEYTGYTAAAPVIQWFWDVVRSFGKEDQARLLQFITGTSKVPLEGFKALQGISGPQRFQIHKAYGGPERLPSAHTCFNQLDLPEYPSKEILQERLLLAIHEANEGFGFG